MSPATLVLTGDVMLGRLMNQVLAEQNFTYIWGDTLPLLKAADFTGINLECVIAKSGREWKLTPKVFHFRAAPQAIDVLAAAGINYVAIANNHTLDFDTIALQEMLYRLDRYQIAHAGAGMNLDAAMQPAIVDVAGTKIGCIAVTDNEPVWEADVEHPGIFYVPVPLDDLHRNRIAQSIAIAKQQADLVLVSAHVGPNWGHTPREELQEFAHTVIDLGADLYHGHSCHVFQGIERYREKFIFYSCGDFVDDYAVDPSERNDQSFLFQITITDQPPASTASVRGEAPSGFAGGGGRRKPPVIDHIELIPVEIENFQVNQARGADATAILKKMQYLCTQLGTTAEERDGHLVLT